MKLVLTKMGLKAVLPVYNMCESDLNFDVQCKSSTEEADIKIVSMTVVLIQESVPN